VKYWDFGPTLASEKLFEIDKVKMSDETLLLLLFFHYGIILIARYGINYIVEEGRGPKCVLMGYIDDAASRAYGRFYEYEGTIPAMDSFKRYVKKYGIPQSVYMDNHSTYKNQAKLMIEEELEGRQNPLSQFERAVEELGVRLQLAPAKGRVERMFRTFQDRAIKEIRLAGVSSIKEGNKFFEEYLPKYNKRFSVLSAEKTDLHRGLTEGEDIDSKLCIKEKRVLRNDYTVSYKTHLYQALVRTSAKKVTVEERITGRIVISYKGNVLKHKEIVKRPVKPVEQEHKNSQQKNSYVPSKDYPWRRRKRRSYPQNYVYQQKEKSSKKEKELLLVH